MPLTDEPASQLRDALRAAFPDARVSLRSEQGAGSARTDWRAQIETDVAALNLLIEYIRAPTGARLRDAIAQIQHIRGGGNEPLWVLASDFLSPAMQYKLRDARVPFIDLAGNAWIVWRGVHIDRRGFPNPRAETRLPRGPFSDKASLVIRALFDSETGRGIRDLAGELGLEPSYVSKVVRELDRRGYVVRQVAGIVLRHPAELLSDWLHAYRGREPVMRRTFFVPVTSGEALLDAARHAEFAPGPDYALTMQSGASLITRYAEFDTLEIYVRHKPLADRIAKQLESRPAARGANLLIMVPYYRVSAFHGERRVQGLSVVSDLQLYLDLYDFPKRGREQAERIYERRLLPLIRQLEGTE
jgi:hypothetical protein